MRGEAKEQALCWIALAAVFLSIAAFGFWNLSGLQVLPDEEWLRAVKENLLIGAISESQASFFFWGNVAMLIVGLLCLLMAVAWLFRGC